MGLPGFTKGRSGFRAFIGVGIFGALPITTPVAGGAPANAVLNNQGGYVRNASGGYVLKGAA